MKSSPPTTNQPDYSTHTTTRVDTLEYTSLWKNLQGLFICPERTFKMSETSENMEQVAEVPETSENMEEVAETPTEVEESTEEVTETERDYEKDSAYAELRRENERLQAELEERESAYEETDETLRETLNADDFADLDIPATDLKRIFDLAEESGEEPESLIQMYLKEVENQQLSAEAQEYKDALEDLEAQQTIETYEREIKSIDPDLDFENLSDTAFSLMAEGASAVDIVAYETRLKDLSTGKPPSVIGKVGKASTDDEFFTEAEVDDMSDDDQRKYSSQIIKSMTKWRK